MLGHKWVGDTTASRIRRARVELGLTIRSLAAIVGVSETHLINIENDKILPSIKMIRQLAPALNMPISYIGKFEDFPEQTLGEKIRKARLYRGLTKKEAAELFKASVRSVQLWERDKHAPGELYVTAIQHFLAVLN